MNDIPEFADDFMISWDFSDHDFPCVNIMYIFADGAKVISKQIATSHVTSGVISLRQVEMSNRLKELEKLEER